jgi:hypothetical protein
VATIEFLVDSGPESNRFDMVFHSFVTACADDVPDHALLKLQSMSLGRSEMKTVTIWDELMADKFCCYWRDLRRGVKR